MVKIRSEITNLTSKSDTIQGSIDEKSAASTILEGGGKHILPRILSELGYTSDEVEIALKSKTQVKYLGKIPNDHIMRSPLGRGPLPKRGQNLFLRT